MLGTIDKKCSATSDGMVKFLFAASLRRVEWKCEPSLTITIRWPELGTHVNRTREKP